MSNQQTTKTCRRGEGCVHPNGPTLPRSEFYKLRGTRDGLQPICKECHKAECAVRYKKNPRQQWRNRAGSVTEKMTVDRLRSFGIYAAPGKCSEYTWVDVVAWGCVRIEVKHATLNKRGSYQFHMGYKRGEEKDRSDLVVLILLDLQPRFFVFRSSDPVFYHEDGTTKRSVNYAPDGNGPKKAQGVSLATEIMSEAEDRWELVEEKRQEVIDKLEGGMSRLV